MGYARKAQICLQDTPFYHCIARCVRRAWLWGVDEYAGRDYSHRKQWVIDRLLQLVAIFAIDVCAYAVMSNHYHLILHVDPQRARQWSPEEVIERWSKIFRTGPLIERWQQGLASPAEAAAALAQIEIWRARLTSISWFLRCLNEYLARRANAEDGCTGRFWGVPRTQWKDPLRCCGEDEGGPLDIAVQTVMSNRPLLLRPKDVVVSEWERRRVACVG